MSSIGDETARQPRARRRAALHRVEPEQHAEIEQNSPAQLVPAPAGALRELLGSAPRTLRAGTAAEAGLLPGWIARISPDVEAGLRPQGPDQFPLFPGAVALAGHRGTIVSHTAHGYSRLYVDSQPTLLPPGQRVRTRTDTIYDLASLSKLFTSIVAMQLVDQDKLDLRAPVTRYLPAFGAHSKGDITIANLLTHTSGLQPDPTPALWQLPPGQRVPAVLDTTPARPVNAAYLYSDLNLMTMALVAQQITGQPLDRLVSERITDPLGMASTMYNPPASLLPRIAATEYQSTPDRGLVQGQVHDENAWALDGVAGHAGVFSDAGDLAVLAQTMLNGGSYGDVRILSSQSAAAMFTNANQAFTGDNHGLGFELYQHWYNGALATPYTAGHTGFTGTSIVIDPTTQSFAILLTNAVHPSRSWGSTNPVRRAVADDLARAMAVAPVSGDSAWYSGLIEDRSQTVTVALDQLGEHARLDFALWYDTEPTEVVDLRQSSDGGTTWIDLPFRFWEPINWAAGQADPPDSQGEREGAGSDLHTGASVSGYSGHRWYAAEADLPATTGPVQLQLRHRTDAGYHGRGVYLNAIRVTDHTGRLFDDRREADATRVAAVGFQLSAD